MSSKVAVFSSGLVLVIGSVVLVTSFLESRDRRRSKTQGLQRRKGKIGVISVEGPTQFEARNILTCLFFTPAVLYRF